MGCCNYTTKRDGTKEREWKGKEHGVLVRVLGDWVIVGSHQCFGVQLVFFFFFLSTAGC